MHEENSFLTLTFANEHLPVDYSVSVRDMQLFMKKLRKAVQPKNVRFFLCGEYGDDYQRPHYHIILFNHDFNDKTIYKYNHKDQPLFTSTSLSKLWPYGLATLGDVTFESAAYTARYCMKKINGPEADQHYVRQHPLHGFFVRVKPEFTLMSRRPGLGQTWFERYKTDVFPSDQVIINGVPSRAPRFYLDQLSEKESTAVKRLRRKQALPSKEHRTNRRRVDRVQVRDARINKLKRDKL